MRLAFYRGTGIFPWAIRQWTGGSWAHVEFEIIPRLHWRAQAGVTSGFAQSQLADEYLDVTLATKQLHTLNDWFNSESGLPYDWNGLLRAQVFGMARSHPGKWFCSESVVAGLQAVDLLPGWLKPCTISPSELHRIWSTILKETHG